MAGKITPISGAWIDRFGSLGHGAASYDQWLNNAKPRDATGQPRAFHGGVLLDARDDSEASTGCSSTMIDMLGAVFKGIDKVNVFLDHTNALAQASK